MNNNLGFWRKLMLSLGANPNNDADIGYVYRNIARPEIPASALWDAERGALERSRYVNPEDQSLSDLRKTAILNRGWGLDQTIADMPKYTPTGMSMEQLLAPDYLMVPDKKDMSNIW